MDLLSANPFSGAPAGFIRRSDFGPDFVFGAATSAFQIEGATSKHGRGLSIWDTFAEKKNLFHPYGEDAVSHYDKFEEDLKMMKDIGFDAYRFSISWARILPTGKKESRNQAGIDFYKNLLNQLKEKGMKTFVTLLHFDIPHALQTEYGGFLNRRIVNDFGDYADVCFQEFGSLVDNWITMNEPFTFSYSGHVVNVHAPGLGTVTDNPFEFDSMPADKDATAAGEVKAAENAPNTTIARATYRSVSFSRNRVQIEDDDDDDDDEESSIFPPDRSTSQAPLLTHFRKSLVGKKSTDSGPTEDREEEAKPAAVTTHAAVVVPSTEDPFKIPYIVTHNQLLAHARAVKVYKDKYQAKQKGKIGITLVSMWFEPLTDDEKDVAAAGRAVDFFLGWFLSPLVKGEYPDSMKEYVTKGHLPKMGADKYLIKGTYDFIGMNYYTSRYVSHHPRVGGNYVRDQQAKFHAKRNGVPLSEEKGASGWLYSYPKGMLELLVHIKEKYDDPLIYVTENGIDDTDDGSSTLWKSFYDHKRVSYIHDHLAFLLEAKRRGVNVQGYFVWSLLDNFEWDLGFKVRFGIIYVDYDSGAKRYPKLSAAWLKNFLADQTSKNNVRTDFGGVRSLLSCLNVND